MRVFKLMRGHDVTGVSGEGHVADVVEFDDGRVVVNWRTERRSTVVWDSLDDAMSVHGHDGATRLEAVYGRSAPP